MILAIMHRRLKTNHKTRTEPHRSLIKITHDSSMLDLKWQHIDRCVHSWIPINYNYPMHVYVYTRGIQVNTVVHTTRFSDRLLQRHKRIAKSISGVARQCFLQDLLRRNWSRTERIRWLVCVGTVTGIRRWLLMHYNYINNKNKKSRDMTNQFYL